MRSFHGKEPGILSPKTLGEYLGVTLCDGMKVHKNRYIHHLVLEAHSGSRPKGLDGLHGDGNKCNNHIGNLHWGTKSENAPDKWGHGTMMFGSDHINSKLNEADVISIRKRYAAGGITQRKLGEEYGVHQVTIFDIVSGKTWNHIEEVK